jgi:hypothetical protein
LLYQKLYGEIPDSARLINGPKFSMLGAGCGLGLLIGTHFGPGAGAAPIPGMHHGSGSGSSYGDGSGRGYGEGNRDE